MTTMNQQLIQAQRPVLAPEEFQAALIDGMTKALLRPSQPPCLLRAPTGSGKTFMVARVLANVSAEIPVVWFWFVPFVNLVAQTQDVLAANASDLSPILLKDGRNQDAAPGQVLLSTVQGVARAQWRKQGYDADGDDDTRTLAEYVTRVRAAGYRLGLVVDEAHIALDKTTEFGQFAKWLAADYLVMATATPKDRRLLDFLAGAGKSEFESFSVCRDDVVKARLNKKYIEAVVYDLRQSTRNITDLQRTVLRQAWLRNLWLKEALEQAGAPLVPLLLVQVANGPRTVEEAEHQLITLCEVPPAAIGKHSADDPDPSLMEAIANDRTKEVLIFKQSAGTGFDAPRAFVLASTKSVSDPDFAMQFIGRVMRVSHQMRATYPRPEAIPIDFDTAYVYLANAEEQRGFEQAVHATNQVKTELEGQTEKMIVRKTASGAAVITNKPVNQFPLSYAMGVSVLSQQRVSEPPEPERPAYLPAGQVDLFATQSELASALDLPVSDSQANRPSTALKAPANPTDVLAILKEKGIRVYPMSTVLPGLPKALKREHRPQHQEMSALSRKLAREISISPHLMDEAIKAACNRLKEIERHTELTTHQSYDAEVLIVTDRGALAKEALVALRSLPQVEEEDLRIILMELANRVLPKLREMAPLLLDGQRPDEMSIKRMTRDAANWIARQQADVMAERLYEAIAECAVIEDAGDLPAAMLFPAALPLLRARKNIYGVFPPTSDDLLRVELEMFVDERDWLKERTYRFDSGESFFCGQFDETTAMNGEELAFAKALDRAEFVAWWHRNPDRKNYSVRIVRGEHRNFFYPDFVVCLEHSPGDAPLVRLVETKENVKDAARKSRHIPSYYGKVLFLTKDQKRVRWVREDGSLGDEIDLDDLAGLREWFRASIPQQ